MKNSPDKKVEDLAPEARKFVRNLIRTFCKERNIYPEANKAGIGLEETEECIEELLNRGELKFFYDSDSNLMYLKKWNSENEEYE